MGKVCAVIVAAGRGTRMGSGINKQFRELKNKPILYYTLAVFERCTLINEIVLVTAKNEMEYCQREIVEKYNINKVSKIVEGGQERQRSVYNGLKALSGCSIVLIHDGARPFVDNKTIEDGIKYSQVYSACTCGVQPKDTIKVKDNNGFSVNTLDRNSLFAVQTPQCFQYDLIINCHKQGLTDGIKVTDDTSVVEYYGHKVFLYEGNYNNIKITTPEDMIIGEKLIDNLGID